MKYFACSLMVVAALTLTSSQAQADPEGSAACQVLVNIVPNVAVNPSTSTVTINSVQTGKITATCIFDVQANTQELDLCVQASNLEKHSDSSYQIPLDTSEPAVVTNTQGEPTDGNAPELQWTGAPAGPIVANGRSYPAAGKTEVRTYGSGQGPMWSQQVSVTVQWDQTDNTLPVGQYSGGVELICMVVP